MLPELGRKWGEPGRRGAPGTEAVGRLRSLLVSLAASSRPGWDPGPRRRAKAPEGGGDVGAGGGAGVRAMDPATTLEPAELAS